MKTIIFIFSRIGLFSLMKVLNNNSKQTFFFKIIQPKQGLLCVINSYQIFKIPIESCSDNLYIEILTLTEFNATKHL